GAFRGSEHRAQTGHHWRWVVEGDGRLDGVGAWVYERERQIAALLSRLGREGRKQGSTIGRADGQRGGERPGGIGRGNLGDPRNERSALDRQGPLSQSRHEVA